MKKGKRVFDLFWTIIGIFLLSPLFLIIMLLIKISDGGPVFFCQKRIGYKGKPFIMYKFRSMVVDADKKGSLITVGKDPRITRIGYWLRKTKLDELPQLFNVLKGEMSLVGPRPEVPKYVDLYTEEQRKVLDLISGMTDLASIEYIDENEILAKSENPEEVYIYEIMPKKIELNLKYASNISLWNDFLIILKTFLKLFRR